jgi:hypothetical protein
VQSQWFGPLYIPIVATTSVASTLGVGGDDHRTRWFEVQASRMGAEYFDKRYGSGADGYVQGSANYFDINSFSNGRTIDSPYLNPRTNRLRQGDHPISGARFSWWDVFVPILSLSLIPLL